MRNKLMSVTSVELRLLKARMHAAEDCLKFLSLNPVFHKCNEDQDNVWLLNHTYSPLSSMLYFVDHNQLAKRMFNYSIESKKSAQLRKVNKKLMMLSKYPDVPVNYE